MNVEEVGYNFGMAKHMNNHALQEMYKAKKLMLKLRVNTFFNPTLYDANEIINELDEYASECIAELKYDKYVIKLIWKVLNHAVKKGHDTFREDFIELIKLMYQKDRNILERYCELYETSMYSLKGISYMSGKNIQDERESYNEKIDAHLLTLGFIEKKES